MKLDTLYVIMDNKLGTMIAQWAEDQRIQVAPKPQKNNELIELVDSVVLFHENFDFSKEDLDTLDILNKNNKAVHKVDINGTLSATNSNFNMWIERNKPTCLLVLGEDKVAENSNLSKFLEGIE